MMTTRMVDASTQHTCQLMRASQDSDRKEAHHENQFVMMYFGIDMHTREYLLIYACIIKSSY